MVNHEWEDTRYSRQEAVPIFGPRGQECLKRSSVAVVGAGGVKSTLLYFLASAGIGRLRIVDFDRVELSNLNRQILYTTEDIGQLKAEVAARRLLALNPEINVEFLPERVVERNFEALLGDFDLLIEGGDSLDARLAFNRCALQLGKTFVHASAHYNYSYVMSVVPFQSTCLECVYGDSPNRPGGAVPILGCATGIAGSVAATEAINILCGKGPALKDRIWMHQGWTNETLSIPITRYKFCLACGTKS